MTRPEIVIDARRELDPEELTIAQLLTDNYCLKIISGMTKKTMSIKEMACTYFIPFATCYKKVAELETAGLIREEGKVLERNGKKHSVYRSTLKNLEVQYKSNTIILTVELQDRGERTITVDLSSGNMVVTSYIGEPLRIFLGKKHTGSA